MYGIRPKEFIKISGLAHDGGLTVTTLAEPLRERELGSLVKYSNTHLFRIGGYQPKPKRGKNDPLDGVPICNVDYFNIKEGAWSEGPALPADRKNARAVCIYNTLYTFSAEENS